MALQYFVCVCVSGETTSQESAGFSCAETDFARLSLSQVELNIIATHTHRLLAVASLYG